MNTCLANHNFDGVAFDNQVISRLLENIEVSLVFENAMNRFFIKRTVGLARVARGRLAFAAI